MTSDQLFEELRSETSIEKRQILVENGLKGGISPHEITEMLDYIDFCASVKQQASQSSNLAAMTKKPSTLSSIWHSLVCQFRFR